MRPIILISLFCSSCVFEGRNYYPPNRFNALEYRIIGYGYGCHYSIYCKPIKDSYVILELIDCIILNDFEKIASCDSIASFHLYEQNFDRIDKIDQKWGAAIKVLVSRNQYQVVDFLSPQLEKPKSQIREIQCSIHLPD